MGIRVSLDKAAIGAAARALLDAAKARGMAVSEDMRVSEEDLATLLGMTKKCLANQRRSNDGPPHYWISVGGSKVSYRLTDAVVWMENRRRVPKPPKNSTKHITTEGAASPDWFA